MEEELLKGSQRPTGTSQSEGGEAHIANLIIAQADVGALSQGPALNCLSESSEACVADLVVFKHKRLRMAHQTNVLGQGSAYAKSQGMGTRL